MYPTAERIVYGPPIPDQAYFQPKPGGPVFPVSSPSKRVAAGFIEYWLLQGMQAAYCILSNYQEVPLFSTRLSITCALILFGYKALCEYFFGASLGKWITGQRLISSFGTGRSFTGCLVRNLWILVLAIPVFGMGLYLLLGRRLHVQSQMSEIGNTGWDRRTKMTVVGRA